MYLNCHTYFSLKYGTISIKGLLEEASRNGVRQLALTDINNTSACLDFVRQASRFDIKPIIGVDFRKGARPLYVAIARNNEGFYEINHYLSHYLHEEEDIPLKAPGFHNVYVIYPFSAVKYDELGDNEYVGVSVRDLSRLPFSSWKKHHDKLVILQPVCFRNKRDYNVHRLLRAIDNNILLSRLPRSEQGEQDDVMIHEAELIERFREYPVIIDNTRNILETCCVNFDFGPDAPHKNQRAYTGNEELDFSLISKLAYKGLGYRYDSISDEIFDRINKELNTIKEKGFVSYFLIAWKIVKYAREKGYFYVGRGSGANSIVSYLLRITDVDPIELDLYFERFINLFRRNPPDFDIDFSWHDREDITRFIFNRFKNVALLATYSTFQYKGVTRELGKVFGLPDDEIRALQANPRQADEFGKLVVKYGALIEGFPSHLSVHAGGILISEKPIHYYSATFMPPKGFATVQFDMHAAEDVGLYKFDILGQRGLAKVKEALHVIRGNGREAPDIHNISKLKQNKRANHLLKTADAIGCFYVESPAMRMLLKKLRVNNYLGLVAASSVIRPGVAQSGMMREYILRFRDIKRRNWAKENHSVLYNLMPETFGVMVYQEDVIKVAHFFAGLSLAEADVLRRGMSGKFRSRDEFQEVKEKFFSNCRQKGYDEKFVLDVWRQIESFAGYAFAKGHSASYAVESYQCLYLKAYYPLEYMVAVLNNGGGFYSTQFYIHEARMCGAEIRLPCINHSNAGCVIYKNLIYLGLSFVDSLETNTIKRILEERDRNGRFDNLRELLDRVPVSLEQICILIRVGAFAFTGKSKKELLWDAHFLLGETKKSAPVKGLFDVKVKDFDLPELWKHPLEDAFDEIELLGFPVSLSLFDLAEDLPEGGLTAKDLYRYINRQIKIIGYLVHVKYTQTKDGYSMNFGTFIDRKGQWIDTVHFPQVLERHPFTGKGCYEITGKVIEELGYICIEVQSMVKLAHKNMDEQNTVVRSTDTYLNPGKRKGFIQRPRLE